MAVPATTAHAADQACTATTDHMHATAGTANIKYSVMPGSRSLATRRACTGMCVKVNRGGQGMV